MTDFQRRIKTIEKRLNMGEPDKVICIFPKRFIDETDNEYQARIDRPGPPGTVRKIVQYRNVVIIPPAAVSHE